MKNGYSTKSKNPFKTEKYNRKHSGGSTPKQREALIKSKAVGKTIETERILFSKNALGIVLLQHRPVILAVNAKNLAPATDDNGSSFETGWENHPGGGHAITAVDGKFDESGTLTHVLISDTGAGKQYWMEADDLQEAIHNHPNNSKQNDIRKFLEIPQVTTEMNVSKQPIKTDCPK